MRGHDIKEFELKKQGGLNDIKMSRKNCSIGGCDNRARYIIGIGKLKVCVDCFDKLPNSEKSDLYYEKLVSRC